MQVSKIEWGALASIIAGAVWIGNLQGNINSLTRDGLIANKENAVKELNNIKKEIINEIRQEQNKANSQNFGKLIEEQNKKIILLGKKIEALKSAKKNISIEKLHIAIAKKAKEINIKYLERIETLQADLLRNIVFNKKENEIEFKGYSYIWSKNKIVTPKIKEISFLFKPSNDKLGSSEGAIYSPELVLFFSKDKLTVNNATLKKGIRIKFPYSDAEFSVYQPTEKPIISYSSILGSTVFNPTSWHTVKIKINKDKFFIRVNNEKIININSNLLKSDYYFGLASGSSAKFRIKNIIFKQ